MHLTNIALSAGVVGLFTLTGGSWAIAQDATSEEGESPTTSEIQPQTNSVPTVDEALETAVPDISQSLDCPPGQFPSAFSDVLPFHWAYEAVNNLASVPMQCFDLPDNGR